MQWEEKCNIILGEPKQSMFWSKQSVNEVETATSPTKKILQKEMHTSARLNHEGIFMPPLQVTGAIGASGYTNLTRSSYFAANYYKIEITKPKVWYVSCYLLDTLDFKVSQNLTFLPYSFVGLEANVLNSNDRNFVTHTNMSPQLFFIQKRGQRYCQLWSQHFEIILANRYSNNNKRASRSKARKQKITNRNRRY